LDHAALPMMIDAVAKTGQGQDSESACTSGVNLVPSPAMYVKLPSNDVRAAVSDIFWFAVVAAVIYLL
jgi:hypothetical protein